MISSFCKWEDEMCVDVRAATVSQGDGVEIRNTNAPGTMVFATWAEWEAFIAGVKAGEFDREKLETAARMALTS